MPRYVVLSILTSEGRKTIREKPERIKEVNEELKDLGVKVLDQYAVLGPYDFVNIVEAPTNEAVAKASVRLGSRGTVQLMSLPAIPIDEFIATVKD
ncbi:MAG: GYD domain-containing protein [Candidatus Bathyarchaeia archaeon]